ncbi:hypothetical protein GE09DRAFT_1145944 [Coniochaeta sp. 2T2.1]|nr:hypothetical protein GE09DRAFT_1145944 [Coniochaeta sp. 2T2.1]
MELRWFLYRPSARTGQAAGDNSDLYLRPVAVFPDPFRGSPNIVVLSECWNADGTPYKFHYRHEADVDVEARRARTLVRF